MKKKNTLIAMLMVLSCSVIAQWSPSNNGIGDLSHGVKLLGQSDSVVFSRTVFDLYRSTDNGGNWTAIHRPDSNQTQLAICVYSFGDRYFIGYGSGNPCMYISTDLGETWDTVSGFPKDASVRGFVHLENDLFAYSYEKGIYKSTDGGSTWHYSGTGLPDSSITGMFEKEGKLFALVWDYGIYASLDTGKTWVDYNNGLGPFSMAGHLLWRMGNNMYYEAAGGNFYVSTNNGVSWDSWSKPAVMGISLNDLKRFGSHLYIKSQFGGNPNTGSIYLSNDEGLNWLDITGNLDSTDLNFRDICETGNYLLVAYDLNSPGKGIYRRTIPTISTGLYPVNELVSVTLFPNPATHTICVNDAALINSHYTIINVCGMEVKQGILQKESIDIHDIPSGLYFLHIEGSRPEKFLKVD